MTRADSSVKYAGGIRQVQKAPRVAFLADAMLGSIARKLRVFGFDTLYNAQAHDDEILKIAMEQDRVILTADKESVQANSQDWCSWCAGKWRCKRA